MASPYVLLNRAIWNDDDFRQLTVEQQQMYLLLWTAPKGSHAGVNDWRPDKIAARSLDLTPARVEDVAAVLIEKHFIVVDTDTEEVLIRSYTRFDRTLENIKHAVSFTKAYAEVESPTLRAVIAYEVGKIQRLSPGLACWSDRRLQAVLSDPATSAKALPMPMGLGMGKATAKADPMPMVKGSRRGMPTTATTTSTATPTVESDVDEPVTAPAAAAAAESDRFDEFWSAYPRTVAKKPARNAFAKALKRASADQIIAGARQYATQVAGKELQYVAHPATWLNGDRWTDGNEIAEQQQAADDARFRAEVEAQAKSPFGAWMENPPDGLTVAQEYAWDQEYRQRLRAKAEKYVREKWDARAAVAS